MFVKCDILHTILCLHSFPYVIFNRYMKLIKKGLNVLVFLLALTVNAQQEDAVQLYRHTVAARYVNPLIGTAGEGYTYPHATSPWGMVSAGPHTTYTTPLGFVFGKTIAPAGYSHGAPVIEGFGQTHLSGVACNELGAPLIAVNIHELTPGEYASAYSNETAKAGYYTVMLDDMRTKVSITTTARAAYYRFEFTDDGTNFILLDAYKNLSWGNHEGYVERIDGRTFSGWSQTGDFCNQGNEQKVYFYLKSLTPAVHSGLWKSTRELKDALRADGNVGAWLSYGGVGTVDIAIGLSYVSMNNAKENLEAEIGNKKFETVLRENIEKWESALGRIKILDKGKEREKEIFYTALYHALLHPNIVSDVNGSYPEYESDGYGVNKDYTRYGLFSMWDSYRTVHPLLSLFYPEQEQDMLYTIEDMTLISGHTPRWELNGSEVDLMVGDPALSILAEGVVKGFKLNRSEQLFDVLYQNATDKNSDWRPGNREYLELGYIPEKTDDVWGSVSTTLEYSYHDWALSEFGRIIGRNGEAARLLAQSQRWRTLFDKKTGLVRPKRKNGEWMTDFDPATMDDSWWVSLVIKNHGGPGFVEGNAYQYTFMVPHDIAGLTGLFGSADAFGRQLKSIFDNGYFTLWNEPDMLYPYLLGLNTGLHTYMQQQLQRLPSTYFTDAPDGIPGNDDAGTLSAWYVFTALGFYPVNPAGGRYALGIPMFNDIQISVPGTDTLFSITANFDVRKGHWTKATYNGEVFKDRHIPHRQIVNGGTLRFVNED